MARFERRKFLGGLAATVGVAGLVGLTACGAEEAPAPAPKPAEPKAEAPKPEKAPPPEKAPEAPAADSDMADPKGPTAVALAYVEDASAAKGNAKFVEGSNCANCQLYTGADGDETGPCTLFAQKKVKAAGWCTGWVKKAG